MHMNVVVGKDVIKLFSLKERKKWFHDQSFRYGETYEDEDGNEAYRPMEVISVEVNE